MRRSSRVILLLGIFLAAGAFILILFLNAGSRGPQATPTPAIHALFHEDFSTRANRWRLFNLGKAVIDYQGSALVMQAKPANYALWSVSQMALGPPALQVNCAEKAEYIFTATPEPDGPPSRNDDRTTVRPALFGLPPIKASEKSMKNLPAPECCRNAP